MATNTVTIAPRHLARDERERAIDDGAGLASDPAVPAAASIGQEQRDLAVAEGRPSSDVEATQRIFR